MNIKDILLSIGERSERFNNKSRRDGISGDKAVLVRLIIGAALYLLTAFSFMQNWFGGFLRIVGFLLCSYDLILESIRLIRSKKIFTTEVLISFAGILAICIGETADALLFILAYRVYSMLEKLIIKRSERSVKRILNLRTRDVKVYADNKLVVVPTDKVKVDDYYMLAPGDIVPLDGIVVNGVSEIETETITGEATLCKVHKGSVVLSGCINVSGTLSVRVTADLENSVVTKRLRYVESYDVFEEKAEGALEFFIKYFTPIACVVALFVGIVPPIFMGNLAGWLHKAAILFALACPLPIFASCAITYFIGVGGAASNGILFKNKEAIDALEQTSSVIFDKNGTLSTGKFSVTSTEAVKVTSKELMELAAIAFVKSDNYLAKIILANVENPPDVRRINNFYEDPGKCCVVQLIDGRVVSAGTGAMLEMMEMRAPETHKGDTVIYVCVGREFVGCIHMSDKFRSDAVPAVKELRELGVESVGIISGDSAETNKIIANNIGLDTTYTAVNVDEKATVLESVLEELDDNKAVCYVCNGDDAEVMEYVDVGVAMNGLISDEAIEHSNVILVKSEVSRLPLAVRFSKRIKDIMNLNITAMTAVTALVAILTVFDLVTMSSAIIAEGITALLALANSTRAFNIKEK